jgi:hypothetical protein
MVNREASRGSHTKRRAPAIRSEESRELVTVNELDRLLTTAEAAHVLRTTKQAMVVGRCKRLASAPPFVRLGRRILYRMGDLQAWLDSNLVDPANPSSG